MKTAALVLLACACASVQAQEVRLEHTDVVGPGFAFLGDEIAIDLVLDFPPPPLFTAEEFTIAYDPGLVTSIGIDSSLPPCSIAVFDMTGAVTLATGAFGALTPFGTPVAGPIDIDDAAVASGLAGVADIGAIDVNVGGFCFSTGPDSSGCPTGGDLVPIVSIDYAALTFAPGQNVEGVLGVTAFSPSFGVSIFIDFDFTAGTFDADGGPLGTVAGIVNLSPATATPCLTVTGSGPGSVQLFFEDAAGFDGLLTAATLHFSSDQTGDALFEISGGGVSPLPISYVETSVTITDTQYGGSGSLPEEFENTTGVPPNWSTFFTPGSRGPGPVWGSTAECLFDNFTGGDGNAACLQNNVPSEGTTGLAGSFLCTDEPLDTSTAVLPVLGLLANFQPNPGGATFRVVGGDTAPPNVAGYTTLFETDDPIGAFGALPGESLTVPLPLEASLYICIVVDGDYAYAEVDECISCAVSYGVPDSDGDGLSDDADNCVIVSNPDQRDTNGDGIGNACDADIAPATNDCIVNALDLQAMKMAFFAVAGQPGYNPDADFDGNGVINFADLGVMKLQYWGPPGPSGLPNACNVAQRAQRLRDCAIPD